MCVCTNLLCTNFNHWCKCNEVILVRVFCNALVNVTKFVREKEGEEGAFLETLDLGNSLSFDWFNLWPMSSNEQACEISIWCNTHWCVRRCIRSFNAFVSEWWTEKESERREWTHISSPPLCVWMADVGLCSVPFFSMPLFSSQPIHWQCNYTNCPSFSFFQLASFDVIKYNQVWWQSTEQITFSFSPFLSLSLHSPLKATWVIASSNSFHFVHLLIWSLGFGPSFYFALILSLPLSISVREWRSDSVTVNEPLMHLQFPLWSHGT